MSEDMHGADLISREGCGILLLTCVASFFVTLVGAVQIVRWIF